MKAKELRRKKSTNEPMKMIFRQCEEAFGNIATEEEEKETTARVAERRRREGRRGWHNSGEGERTKMVQQQKCWQ